MQKTLLILFSILSITILAIFILISLPEQKEEQKELSNIPETLTEPEITFIDPVLGASDARITIVEFSDYDCPLCKTIEPELRAFIQEVPNRRRLIWKDAPNTNAHPQALDAAIAARCAQDQGQFWEYHDKLLKNGFIINAQNLLNTAGELNLNQQTFQNCIASKITLPIIEHTLNEAKALGVTGTPTIFLNGKEYKGPLTTESLNQAAKNL